MYRRQNQPISPLLRADTRREGLLLGILCMLRLLGLSQRYVFASGIKKAIFPGSKSPSGQAGNTAVQVWTVEEGFGIGGKFRQRRCAANFRDHKIVFFRWFK